MAFKYEQNETMKIIGKQNILELGDASEDFRNEIDDIIMANLKNGEIIGYRELGMDLVLLGIMYGKRLERRKKAGAK
jgi:hypothetical protein